MYQAWSTALSQNITDGVTLLEHAPSQAITFLADLLFSSNPTDFNRGSTTWCPHMIIVTVVDTVDIETLFTRKDNLRRFFSLTVCSNPI